MFCEKCGKELQPDEKFCTGCGTPVAPDEPLEPVADAADAPEVPEAVASEAVTSPEEAPVSEAVSAPEEAPEAAPASEAAPAAPAGSGSKLGLKLNKGVMIAVGCVAAVLVVALCFGGKIGNLVKKSFSTPEKYYQGVENKTVKETAKSFGAIYDNYFVDAVNLYNTSYDLDVSFELGKSGEDLFKLAGLAGVDLEWLKKIEVSTGIDLKDTMAGFGLDFSMNKEKLISTIVSVDTEKQMAYIQLPDLNKNAIAIDMDGMLDNYSMVTDASKALVKAMPSGSTVSKLVNRYLTIALSKVEDVKKKDKSLSCEGITQNVTELKVTIDEDTLDDIRDALEEEMQDDKELRKVFENILEAAASISEEELDVDVDDAYESFVTQLCSIVDGFKYYVREDQEIVVKTYVDGNGDIVGREIEYTSYRGEKTISYKKVTKGGKFGFEFEGEIERVPVKITGSGKESGSSMTGEFTIKVDGVSYFDLKVKGLKTGDLKKGLVNGQISISPSASLVKEANLPSKIRNMELVMKISSSKNSQKVSAELKSEKDSYATISVAVSRGNGSKAKVPGKYVVIEDMDDVAEWAEELDISKLTKKLNKMGLPEEAVEFIEDFVEQIEDGNFKRLPGLGLMNGIYGIPNYAVPDYSDYMDYSDGYDW